MWAQKPAKAPGIKCGIHCIRQSLQHQSDPEEWIKNAETPVSLDVRDDRIHLFVDLTREKQVYYYAVRAVSVGNYKMGPVSAEAMYRGEYHSYNGGGTVKIND